MAEKIFGFEVREEPDDEQEGTPLEDVLEDVYPEDGDIPEETSVVALSPEQQKRREAIEKELEELDSIEDKIRLQFRKAKLEELKAAERHYKAHGKRGLRSTAKDVGKIADAMVRIGTLGGPIKGINKAPYVVRTPSGTYVPTKARSLTQPLTPLPSPSQLQTMRQSAMVPSTTRNLGKTSQATRNLAVPISNVSASSAGRSNFNPRLGGLKTLGTLSSMGTSPLARLVMPSTSLARPPQVPRTTGVRVRRPRYYKKTVRRLNRESR